MLLTLVITTLFSCSNEDVELVQVFDKTNTPYMTNQPLPKDVNTLRVLAIGNSYTIDGTAYLPHILTYLQIDPEKYGVYAIVAGSASLEYWDGVMQRNEPVELKRRAGNLQMDVMSGTIRELLAQPWDIVVFQQVSYLSMTYSSFNPYLHHLMNAVKQYCTNENVTLAWHMTHSYASIFPRSNGVSSVARWQSIASCVRSMMRYDGIDVIIPMGTAIENARLTSLCTPSELTRDGTHLSYGTARYVATCTWVGALFCPIFGCDLADVKLNHELEDYEIMGNEGVVIIPGSSVPVTDDNRELCIQCAVNALKHPFGLAN